MIVKSLPAVGLVYDPVYLNHNTGAHPENARRLTAIIEYLNERQISERLIKLPPRPATEDELSLIHRQRHIQRVMQKSETEGGLLDADTPVSPGSYNAALYAAGGVIRATEAVMQGEVNSAFALVRPPGHHATPEAAMGFCLFNNIAIGAQWARTILAVRRIAIIDFDVHHGNGTQAAFDANPEVMYVSTHQSPLYPGTGAISDTGTGAARGTKVNIPLPPDSGDAEYRRAYTEVIIPLVTRFQPELIMVSAGYDAHYRDDLAGMRLTVSGYGMIIKFIKEMAIALCRGRLVLTLEGGYDLPALAAAVGATFDILLGAEAVIDPLGQPAPGGRSPDINPLLQRLKQLHRLD
jgi:acetoin utilization deacetylase AcuC-like enzyme